MGRRRARIVVVTGASAGVGRATAIEFARQGARVALLARGAAGLAGARIDVERAGGEALELPTDVGDAEQVETAAREIEERWGAPEVWVNAAMATVFSPAWRITPEEFRRATATTYLGTVHGTLAALRRMERAGRGVIVQVSSALSYRSIPLQAPYCGAKFAVRGFTESLRCELLHERSPVRLTMVHLSAFNTPQFEWARSHMERLPKPVPPVYAPEVAARAIAWAADHRRRDVYVGAPALKTVIASRLLPGALADRIAADRAWAGQLLPERAAGERPDNLESPIPRDFGVRGRFNDTRRHSVQFALSRHRTPLLAAAGVAVLAMLLAARSR